MANNSEKNATCIICGKKYHLCIACERNKSNWKFWKVLTDTENCYKVYQVVNDYNFNKISKDEARVLLEALDLSELETYKDSVKKTIKDILKTKRNTRFVKKEPVKVEENFEEVTAVSFDTGLSTDEIVEE